MAGVNSSSEQHRSNNPESVCKTARGVYVYWRRRRFNKSSMPTCSSLHTVKLRKRRSRQWLLCLYKAHKSGFRNSAQRSYTTAAETRARHMSQTNFTREFCYTLTHARLGAYVTNTFYTNANLLLLYTPIWRIKCFINNRTGSTNHDCSLIRSSQYCVLNLVSVGRSYSFCWIKRSVLLNADF